MADPVLLSPEWMAIAVERGRRGGFPDADLRVEYRCAAPAGELTHHQAFLGGRLAAWERGPAPAADLVLRQPLDAHVGMLARAGRGDGNGLLVRTRLIDPGSGRALPPPPLDEVVLDWAADLPSVPTAGPFVVHQVLTHSPFGTVTTWHRADQARLVGAGVGDPPGDAPGVMVRRRYADALAERSGHIDVLESLQRGQIEGDVHLLMLLLGIYDSDECRDGRRALTTPATRHLAVLGELLASPAWREVTEAVSL
jgi:hypothetical protein